jgi:hypothetical protein
VALTSAAATSPGYQEYIATASSSWSNSINYDAWAAFNGNVEEGTQEGWISIGGSYDNATPSLPVTTGINAEFFNSRYGDWLNIKLPHKIVLSKLHTYPRTGNENPGVVRPNEHPDAGYLYGSNDGFSTFQEIYSFDGVPVSTTFMVPTIHTINATKAYNEYRFQVTKLKGQKTATTISEMELYGIPEYDPEAHGTDVTVKSYPNVPNTDWLEVYYDGQDYPNMPATVDNKTGVSIYDATSVNNVGFDATQKAFTFDAASSQYLSSSTPVDGNYIHSISIWFKGTNLTPTTGDTLMWIGDNVNNERIEIYLESDKINYSFKTNDVVADIPLLNNRWYHLTVTYNGVAGVSGREIYLDGVKQPTTHTGNSAVLAVDNNTLNLGGFSGTSTAYMFSGSIANFRLFNRALTQDEIYQLYAYQKEDFGHSTNNMTLKAGRLGIGTSEPRGALDVRGDAYYGCPVFFTAYYGNSGTNNNIAAESSPNYTTLVFNYTMVNKGGAYNLSTGRCTFPISGYYEVLFRGGSASTAGCQTWIFRNGVAPTTWTASGLKSVGAAWDSSSGTFRNLGIIHFFDYFEAGEYLDVRIVNGSFNASNYNSFSVKYLSN